MGLYTWKFPFRRLLTPLAKALRPVHPDIVSYAAVIVACATGFCFLYAKHNQWLLLVAIVLTFARMTLNTLDGIMAINRGSLRLEGEIVNALPDRYSDIFVMLGIAFSGYCNVYIGAIAAVSVLLVSYAGMLGKAIGLSWQHDGPLGKVERLMLIMVMCGLQFAVTRYWQGEISLFSQQFSVITLVMLWFIISAQLTVFNRLQATLKEIKEKAHV
ncbi:MAG: CDP-alcohol phosphatidyltransferase family protein [Candidatus Omnitrophica bacterium]|nr:CDP-alcohol phosphatidyltransferase family protein [Candidatus Omnitrophota bacterium]